MTSSLPPPVRSFFTIVNPQAGGGRCGAQARGLLDSLRAAGIELDLHETRSPGHARELACTAAKQGARAFLAVGGDGTGFEVVDGVHLGMGKHPTQRLTLGLLPLGTGNSFLRDFGVRSQEQALDALRAGRTRACDMIEAEHSNGRLHYINLLSLGFSARAGALMNRRFKALGTAGYVLAVLGSVAKLEYPVDAIRFDGGSVAEREPAALLSFSNSRYTGGSMQMAPTADVADGQLDVIRVGKIGRMRFVSAFPRIFRGTHIALEGIEHRRAQRVDFEDPREQDVMVDGEVLRLTLRSLQVRPGAIDVVAQ